VRPSALDPQRWRKIDQVFEAALGTPPAERASFLAEACQGDDELRGDVEALLAASERDATRFDGPVSPLGAALVRAAATVPERRQVGPFRILREIGRGGMGVVYLAQDPRLGRYVALKALPPYLGVGAEAKRRFIVEARALSQLDHPNIATLHEIDETDDGQLYMVFAFYEGETLDARIARGPLPPAQAVPIASAIAEGLAAAHARGIVHRDVKPSNVLLTASGDVKLLDFGVAKVAGEELTGEDVRLGTVAYMSPEQADSRPIDGRTDLWSLGVVLHEMLTGERPFAAADRTSLIRAILEDDPAPLASRHGPTSDALQQVVAKLLSKAPRYRYRRAEDLCADLRALEAGASPSIAIRGPSPSKGKGPRSRRRASAVLLGLAVVGVGVWLATNAAHPRGRIASVAVLPLENLTGDSTQQYFVDGVHTALIGELGKIASLSVISRPSVLRYRSTGLSVPEIAQQLDVDGVVVGAVLREGDSVEVNAQLVAASPERELWSETYRRGVGDVFKIADDVARSIAGRIGVSLSPDEEDRLTSARRVDPAGYDAFTLGQFNLDRRSSAGFDLAQKYLRRAIDLDSSFAPAYTALAAAYGSAAFFGLQDPARTMPVVRKLAAKALAIDSTLAAAHATLSLVKLYWDWDWTGAEREARRAIALNPSNAAAHRALSEILAVRGHYREALAEVERGSELNRFVGLSAFRPVVVLNYMGDFDGAIERARAGLQFFTDFWQGHWLLCESLAGKDMDTAAIPECERAVTLSGRTPMALGALGSVYALSGRTDEARQILTDLEQRASETYVGASYIAMVYAGLGDRDRAFAWLDRAFQQGDVPLVHTRHQLFFRPLRSDPRFRALLQKMGLPTGDDATGVVCHLIPRSGPK
jgi:TolB-like protein/tetratricopeptide (TPR) repeat protein